jgi:pimeloyl-ACP methyl ester carboxylesterase
MVPDAFAERAHYRTLRMPVVIVAGAEDRLLDTGEQSGRLHRDVPHSVLREVPGAGHMVHQTAPAAVLAAIDEAAAATRGELQPSLAVG